MFPFQRGKLTVLARNYVTRNRQCIYIESEGLENYITFGSFDIYLLFHITFFFSQTILNLHVDGMPCFKTIVSLPNIAIYQYVWLSIIVMDL